MSGIPRSRKLWITPLSPVHMGTDEDYTPTGYVIEGNALYEFDERALEKLPRAERRALNALLDGRPSPAMLKRVQAFFHRNREWLIPQAVNLVPVSEELAGLYRARVGKAANVEAGGREAQNRLGIERAAYNPLDHRLMLPGSGLKGAMRTALLDAVKGEKTLKDLSFYDKRDRRERPPRNNREMQEAIFQGSFATDPMRLVQVGDCPWHGPETLNSAEILFAVNRKKHPVVDENGNLRTAQGENLYQLLECAAPFRFRAFQGMLTVPDTSSAENRRNKLPEIRFSFDEIAAACNRFYRPIFERETELLRKRGFLDTRWREAVEYLLDDTSIRQRLDRNDAFLLRVGRHSGAESVTLNDVRSIRIKDRRVDKNIAKAIKEAKEDRQLHNETLLIDHLGQEIQLPVKLRDLNVTRSGELFYFKPSPKTIWLASTDSQDQRHLRPFGWLLVEMTEPDEEPPSWPAAEALMEPYTRTMSQWLAKARARQSELAREQQAMHEEAERRAREAAEREAEAARLAREKAEKLAAMSPLEREIEAFCEQFAGNNPGAELFNRLNSGQWENPADQKVVAEKIRSLWRQEKRWNPAFSGKNRQKVKQRDRCIEVLGYLEPGETS